MTEIKPETDNAQFIIQRLYVKDLSFEAPGTPQAFREEPWNPDLELDLNTKHQMLETGVYEVVLHVTATAKNKNRVAFLAEVKQAGIFTIQGTPKEQLDHLLGSFCPNILFPYAREQVTSMVVSASFPPLVLAPINFDAIYLQRQNEEKKAADKVETSH